MTLIDFYILGKEGNAGLLFACKLVDKVYHLSHTIYIHTESKRQAQQIDDLLWTFKQGSFLPHDIHSDQTPESPIIIGYGDNSCPHTDVMVNISGSIPAFFSQFERVAEIVHGDDSTRQTARENYKFYKDRGYTLNTHNI